MKADEALRSLTDAGIEYDEGLLLNDDGRIIGLVSTVEGERDELHVGSDRYVPFKDIGQISFDRERTEQGYVLAPRLLDTCGYTMQVMKGLPIITVIRMVGRHGTVATVLRLTEYLREGYA